MVRHLLVLGIIAVCAPSCVGNRPYRVPKEVAVEKLMTKQFDPTEPTNEEWPYRLTFIEFDDRGEMFNRQQLTGALAEVATAKAGANAMGVSPIVAVFV